MALRRPCRSPCKTWTVTSDAASLLRREVVFLPCVDYDFESSARVRAPKNGTHHLRVTGGRWRSCLKRITDVLTGSNEENCTLGSHLPSEMEGETRSSCQFYNHDTPHS